MAAPSMIGRMSERIILLQATATADGMGGQTAPTWDDVVTVWAEHLPASVRERFVGQAVENTVRVAFRIRAISGLLPEMRVRWRGVDYHIRGIAPHDDVQWQVVDCEQVRGE